MGAGASTAANKLKEGTVVRTKADVSNIVADYHNEQEGLAALVRAREVGAARTPLEKIQGKLRLCHFFPAET